MYRFGIEIINYIQSTIALEYFTCKIVTIFYIKFLMTKVNLLVFLFVIESFFQEELVIFQTNLLKNCTIFFKFFYIVRGLGPGGAWGGRAPPRIGDLWSKIFENW